MEKPTLLKKKKELFFLIIMYLVGIVGHLLPSTRELMLSLTPFTLLLTGGVVAYKTLSVSDRKFIYWGILTYLITFFLEVIGVKFGIIFGNYNYGDVLGISIFEVPLIIGFNWVLVILGAISISRTIFRNTILISLSASILAVIFDFFLEPVAIKLNYWAWGQIEVPLQNYIAWFLISFTFSIILLRINRNFNKGILSEYFLIQLLFFLTLNFFMR